MTLKMNCQRRKIMFRLKFYAAMFALVIGLLTAFSQTAQGQTIVNPSFEADNMPASPGYGAITGWTVTGFEGSSGINNSTGPFANNGTIPDGQKVVTSKAERCARSYRALPSALNIACGISRMLFFLILYSTIERICKLAWAARWSCRYNTIPQT